MSHRKRILVVDDHEDIRGIVLKILAARGYRVSEARTAAEAITILARDSAFDMVVADIVMPGAYSGIELAEDIARHWPGIPVVLMSGNPHEITLARGAAQRPILRKPFGPHQIAQRVAETMVRRQARAAA